MIVISKKAIFLFVLFIFSFAGMKAQTENENWVLVDTLEAQTIFINTDGLSSNKGDDIYFWTLEKHNPPIIIESLENPVEKTKTYYLVNKVVKKYSIMQIIYYDKNDNVLANYSYKRNMDNEKVKYNYPIMPESVMDKVINKCLTYIK